MLLCDRFRRRMYRFAPLKTYCDKRDGDGSGYADCRAYLNFALYSWLCCIAGLVKLLPHIDSKKCVSTVPPIINYTHHGGRYARIAHQKGTIWRATDTDKGCHCCLKLRSARAQHALMPVTANGINLGLNKSFKIYKVSCAR